MGRQLASFDGIAYTYNETGIRTSKTSNGATTRFYLNGTDIIEQTDGTTTLYFYYDSGNELIGFNYADNDYIYVKNQQGDITDITNSSGEVVASYTYDPWGKITSISGTNLEIANLNPFRYRSYYYDSDIQMYYLQSRYYDPEVCRFINCDDVNYIGITESEVSYNPFAYCENEPVNSNDIYGYASRYAIITNRNVDNIVKTSYKMYINSGLFKYKVQKYTLKNKDKTLYSYVPNFYWSYYYYNNKGNVKIYMDGNINLTKNSRNIGLFQIKTVKQWYAEIVLRHESKILKIRTRVIKQLQKKYPNLTDDIDTIFNTIDQIQSVPYIEYVSFGVSVYQLMIDLLKYSEKYRTKKEKYILNILGKIKNKNSLVLILLGSESYIYKTDYYQSGVYWVRSTGWKYNKTYYPY